MKKKVLGMFLVATMAASVISRKKYTLILKLL
mgnify:CR=1 FL=1